MGGEGDRMGEGSRGVEGGGGLYGGVDKGEAKGG